MEGSTTIVGEEKRDFIYKVRAFYEKLNGKVAETRQSYQENFVDTGYSQEIEEKIEQDAENTKKAVKVAGTAATIALMFCPADGPFGEIATLLATPAFCELVNVAADIKKKSIITQKRAFEKYFMKADGKNPNVSGYDLTNNEIIDDLTAFANNLDGFTKGAR